MSKVDEMARDLGQALGRTDEYQALKRAAAAADEDRELTRLRNELERLEESMVSALRAEKEPDDEQKQRYEQLARELQSRAAYQHLVSAQANFDKTLQKVNQTISRGIEEGSESRIIFPG